jgi:putative nucleotidyltransferase with HDIG domain
MKQPEFSKSLVFKLTLPLRDLFFTAGKVADSNFKIPFTSRSFSDKKHNPSKTAAVDEISQLAKSFARAEKDLHTVYLDLVSDLKNANNDLIDTYDAALQGWSDNLELRGHEMEKKHTSRVAKYAQELARYMGVSEQEIVAIRRGAFLHDIGKTAIPDRILEKNWPLSKEEWDIVRQHPTHGYMMLRPIEYLEQALDIPYCHHERWDGSGYPRGLQGTAIPLSARIFSVVDVWDTLTHHQPYRLAWPQEEALAYIGSSSGQQFDPHVVEKFLEWFLKQKRNN